MQMMKVVKADGLMKGSSIIDFSIVQKIQGGISNDCYLFIDMINFPKIQKILVVIKGYCKLKKVLLNYLKTQKTMAKN